MERTQCFLDRIFPTDRNASHYVITAASMLEHLVTHSLLDIALSVQEHGPFVQVQIHGRRQRKLRRGDPGSRRDAERRSELGQRYHVKPETTTRLALA